MKIPNRIRMLISEIGTDKIESVLNDIKASKSVMAVYQTKDDVYKLFHSGLAEDNYATLLIMLSRHIGIFDFIKLAIINTELFRKGNGQEGLDFIPKALEYIEWKKNNYNQIRKNDII